MKTNQGVWIAVGAIVLAGLIIGAYSLGQGSSNTAPTSQTEVASKPAVSLDTQNQCSGAAQTFFARWKTDGSLSNSWAQAIAGSGGTASYNDHYNSQLGKCIIRINGVLYNKTASDGSYYNLMFVYDVYENKLLAYSNNPSRSDIGIPLCEFPSNPDTCKNPTAFGAAVDAYMTN